MKQRIKIIFAGGLVALSLIGGATAGQFEDGQDAYQRQDYATALQVWRLLADHGDAKAQNKLGNMYANGQGVPRDYAEAMKWYRLAANLGLPNAEANLGLTYAQGRGVTQDYIEGLKWMRKAADQGFAPAQNSLGFMYDNGQGVAQDYAQAVTWYRRAADQGNAMAQSNLGLMYAQGRGVPNDYILAYMWLSLSSAQGYQNAIEARDLLANDIKYMSSDQIAEAQRMAREWVLADAVKSARLIPGVMGCDVVEKVGQFRARCGASSRSIDGGQ